MAAKMVVLQQEKEIGFKVKNLKQQKMQVKTQHKVHFKIKMCFLAETV